MSWILFRNEDQNWCLMNDRQALYYWPVSPTSALYIFLFYSKFHTSKCFHVIFVLLFQLEELPLWFMWGSSSSVGTSMAFELLFFWESLSLYFWKTALPGTVSLTGRFLFSISVLGIHHRAYIFPGSSTGHLCGFHCT